MIKQHRLPGARTQLGGKNKPKNKKVMTAGKIVLLTFLIIINMALLGFLLFLDGCIYTPA